MSWTLFFQILVLVVVVGCVLLAALDRIYYKDAQPYTPPPRVTTYCSITPPEPTVVEHGDTWYNPDDNKMRVWNADKNDWMDLI